MARSQQKNQNKLPRKARNLCALTLRCSIQSKACKSVSSVVSIKNTPAEAARFYSAKSQLLVLGFCFVFFCLDGSTFLFSGL